MKERDITHCRNLAKRIRIKAVDMVHGANSAHIGGSLSMADILGALYGSFLRLDPARPKWEGRDRFILSKGHACAGLYAALAFRGYFPEDWLDTFYRDGGRLAGHATSSGVPGIEFSTGSLGHGLPVAAGMAYAAKLDCQSYRTVALLSDGECDEGSTWEAALFAPQYCLDNLLVIVDYNKIQSLGHTKEVLDLDPFADKWRAFGWAVEEVDGHDMPALLDALARFPLARRKPSCLIAHTVKGKGVSFMEDKLLWHYRNPSRAERDAAVAELEARP
jgi:transketolase